MIDYQRILKYFTTNFWNIETKSSPHTNKKHQQGRPHNKNRQINKITHVAGAIRDPHVRMKSVCIAREKNERRPKGEIAPTFPRNFYRFPVFFPLFATPRPPQFDAYAIGRRKIPPEGFSGPAKRSARSLYTNTRTIGAKGKEKPTESIFGAEKIQ